VELTSDKTHFKQSNKAKINYSDQQIEKNELHLTPHHLLKEKSIESQQINVQFQNSLPFFFQTNQNADFQYDIFAASFYLLARYEEYLPFKADEHGRFPASESLASRASFLSLPVVNLWLLAFKKVLLQKFPTLKFQQPKYRFQPTLDIDMAWAYRYKGWKRILGGSWRSLSKGAINDFFERFAVLMRLKKDPYFIFPYFDELHKKYKVSPIFFFLVGIYDKYDKNIPPEHSKMRDLIQAIHRQYPLGVHPSYHSNEDLWILRKEVKTLSDITRRPVLKSRQHYLKLHLPLTYQKLIKAGIQEDYSMGYADQVGFRASVAHSFWWYDLKKEEQTNLRIHPFQIMEVTLKEYLHLSPKQAEAKIIQLIDATKQVGGDFRFIWHNSSFSSIGGWEKWRYLYEWMFQRTENMNK